MKVLRLELAILLRERRLTLALVIVATVLSASGVAGLRAAQRSHEVRAAVATRERARWLGQGARDPHSAAHQSVYAFKPVMPLSALEPGVDPFVGESVWLEAHVQNDLVNRPMQDSTTYGRLGVVDPAGLFLRFAPLMVFLLAIGFAAPDRQQGTLALALTAARSGRQVAGIKALSIALVSSCALVLPLACTGLGGMAAIGADGDALGRLAGWVAAALMYVALLSLAGVVVALRARTRAAAFGQLFGVWIVMVLAAPVALSALAERAHSLPSFQVMKIRLERDVPAYWTAEVGAERLTTLLQRLGVEDEATLTERQLNLRGLELDYAERLAQSAFDREIGSFYQEVLAQDRLYSRMGWLSPAVAFEAVSPALAGTDFSQHLQFVQAAEHYRRDLVNRMNADLLPNPAVNGVVHTNDERLWSQVASFAYPLPGWGNAWRVGATPLAALGAWFLGILTVFLWITPRLKP
jgi:ABC-2 type transport system permease protein